MAAAVVDQDRRRIRQRGRHRVPESVIHAEGMDEDDRRGVFHASADFAGELRPVADLHSSRLSSGATLRGSMPGRSASGPHGCKLHTHIMRASKVPWAGKLSRRNGSLSACGRGKGEGPSRAQTRGKAPHPDRCAIRPLPACGARCAMRAETCESESPMLPFWAIRLLMSGMLARPRRSPCIGAASR